MAKCCKWLFSEDKLLHILCSLIVTLWGFGIMQFFMKDWTALICSLCLTLAIGGAKEVYDKLMPNHTCDIKDFYADCIGTALGVIPILFIL